MRCEVTLVNRNLLLKHLFKYKINTISTSLKVRRIGAFKHKSGKLQSFHYTSQAKTRLAI